MAATIKDVAKKANVSISTVSRVLSNQMHVSSSTYKRIQDAVAELNYIPNSSAVSLVKKSSTTVLYADSFYKGRPYENPHMFDIISGSSHELRKKGYFLGLLDLDCSKEKAEEQIINAIQSKKADGILINDYYVTPAIEKILLATDFPHICIGKPSFDSMLSWIDTNHSLSSNLAITHLVSLGHKKSPSSAVLTKTIFTEIVFWDIGCLSSATISHPEMPMSSLLLAIWKKSSNIPRSFCDYRNLPTAFCALTVLSPSASSRQSVSSACAFRRTFLLSPSTITLMHL